MSEHIELKRRAEEILEIERLHPCGSTRVILVNPETVLALLAEVDRLAADNTSLRGSCAKLGAEHAGMVRQIKKLKGAKP